MTETEARAEHESDEPLSVGAADSDAADFGGAVTPLGAGEAAQVIAALVTALPDETLRQLDELLAHSIAAPKAAERREASLGLVIEMVSVGTGEVPSSQDYEQLRVRRRQAGQQWPTARRLTKLYGHWLRVVRAAMRLVAVGAHARVKERPADSSFSETYSREEVLVALKRFHRRFKTWATPWEFLEWAQLERAHARRHGLADPRIPGMKQITKRFGAYDRAVQAVT